MDSLLEIFEQTVQRFPDKTAIACRDERYTFAELKNVSQRLGQRLTVSESRREPAPIGVIARRGVDTAVFFLAALYGGSFYVPLDPDLPREKLARVFADAAFPVVFCAGEERETLREIGFAGEILTLADAAETSAPSPEMPPALSEEIPAAPPVAGNGSADTPAYMIYTSGSTGEPKGVLKSHGAVIDFMETYLRLFDLGPEEIIGNQTPFFFDASAKDFYLMLFTGATLEILPTELFTFPVTLIEYMNERRISYICWVPSALSVVTQLNTFSQVVPTDLKKIFFVGETFPVKQLQKWMEALPEARYVNLYGSTEIAGVCCYCELSVPFDGDEIPLGQPLPNCRVFLLEMEEGQGPAHEPDTGEGQRVIESNRDAGRHIITEPDHIGELCVASAALAMEYYHDPVRTAATFVTLHLPDGTKVRALRTGDLAKYRSAGASGGRGKAAVPGELYFVSRSDDQIKHMGHRIELGEIEAAANRIPEMARCCCLYDRQMDRISLYCEMVAGCDWDKREIRHALSDRLSAYMLPNRYMILDEIPLNANGKADRTRLKEMG